MLPLPLSPPTHLFRVSGLPTVESFEKSMERTVQAKSEAQDKPVALCKAKGLTHQVQKHRQARSSSPGTVSSEEMDKVWVAVVAALKSPVGPECDCYVGVSSKTGRLETNKHAVVLAQPPLSH